MSPIKAIEAIFDSARDSDPLPKEIEEILNRRTQRRGQDLQLQVPAVDLPRGSEVAGALRRGRAAAAAGGCGACS